MDRGRAVRQANRTFYDVAAGVYEAVDGRRPDRVPSWLDAILADLAARSGGGTVLDLGTGTGWALKGARPYFSRLVATDISLGILARARGEGAHLINCEAEALPITAGSVDVVVSFAVLHHVWDHEALIREVGRVLRPGGLFYSDHDLDRAFMQRFRPLMAVYRGLARAGKRYQRADPRLTAELYALAEVHAAGIDAAVVLRCLCLSGFDVVEPHWHWLGLGGLTDRLFGRFGHEGLGQGWAPLFSVIAQKRA